MKAGMIRRKPAIAHGNLLGLVQSGPSPVTESGTLIMAAGPALCSPLNGVGLVTSKPHAAASWGLLNGEADVEGVEIRLAQIRVEFENLIEQDGLDRHLECSCGAGLQVGWIPSEAEGLENRIWASVS
jgi:hypothetical protein